jgi:tetratricopeptide (TPR) repeat protein
LIWGSDGVDWLKTHRTKLWVAGVALLLVFYLVLTFNRAVLLLADPQPVAKAIGAAYFVLPLIGAWALVREILFGAGLERLGRELEAEGGLPEDNLPRTPGGRIVRDAADAQFPAFQAETEASPQDWRAWYRLGLAYDASGDRKRARAAMRRAIALRRTAG